METKPYAVKTDQKIYKYRLWTLAKIMAVQTNGEGGKFSAAPIFRLLAERVGVDESAVYRWANLAANSRVAIEPETLKAIADFFGVKGYELYSEYYRVNYLNIK